MAEKEKKERKGLLGKAIDAVTSRDEKAAAEAAEAEAAAAQAQAAREEAKRQIAEARAAAVARKAEASAAAAEEAEKKLKEAEEAEMKAKQEEARAKLEAYQAEKAEEEKPPTYIVKGGDSLSKIAKEQLGSAARWPEIFELNKDQIANPNVIRVGQELKLPK